MLTHFSLFTGIGGIDLAAEWAGFETVGQCEWADYPTKVLEKHWPNVPRWRDIRSVTRESCYDRGVRTVDLVSGGFPCQPFSVAGKKRGEEDDRYLWPEMVRVIQELRPTWVLGENVTGIINLALDKVLSDLEDSEYSAQAYIIPACSQNASHRRDRVFIVAHDMRIGLLYEQLPNKSMERRKSPLNENSPSNMVAFQDNEERFNKIESRLCGSVDGIPNWMDRIKCLGNAVVPQQVYPILKAIHDIECGISR